MDGMNLDLIDRWKSFFDSSGVDVFEAIEGGIMAAVWYEPDEFLMRRDHIAELLFKKKGDARGSNIRRFDTKNLSESSNGSSCTQGDNNIMQSKSCSGQDQEAPAETTKSDKLKTRTIIKIKRSANHKSGYERSMAFRGSCHESTNDPTPLLADTLLSCRKGKQFSKIGHVQNAPGKSLKQCTGISINSGEEVQEKPKPEHICIATPATYVTTDTPKTQTRRIEEMQPLKLPNGKDVHNEAEKSVQQSKGKQFDHGHLLKAPKKLLKPSTGGRISDEELVQKKPKLSNRDEEAMEFKLKATKRKLHEQYEEIQNARKKIQVVEFQDLPRPTDTCAETKRAKEHMRNQKGYLGRLKR